MELVILCGGFGLFWVVMLFISNREEKEAKADESLTTEEKWAKRAERKKPEGIKAAVYWIGLVLFCFLIGIGMAMTGK